MPRHLPPPFCAIAESNIDHWIQFSYVEADLAPLPSPPSIDIVNFMAHDTELKVMTESTHMRTSVTRRPLLLLAALVLFLAGCGARIDTLLTVDNAGEGSRVMTLTLNSEDLEDVSGSIEDIDASISTHLPEVLEYDGISEVDGGYTTNFTFTFTDADDYRDKVRELLNAGDIPVDDDALVFNTSTDKFVSGVTLIETYTSADLLDWLFDGMEADGILDPADRSNAWEMGETTVLYNDVEYDSYERVSLDKSVDNGFRNAKSTISFTDAGFHREIVFSIDSKAQYTSNQELYDEHFAELEDAGLSVTKDDSSTGVSWTVSFDAEDDAQMVSKSNTAFSSEESVFTSSTTYEDGFIATKIESYAECSAVCAGGVDAENVMETITPPAGSTQADTGYPEEGYYWPGEALSTTFTTLLPLEDVSTTLTVDPEGPVSSTFKFSVPSDKISGMSEQIADSLIQGGGGDVNSEEQEDNTHFSVRISGEDAAQFANAYSTWSGMEVQFAVTEIDSSSPGDYEISGWLPTPDFVIDGDVPMAGKITVEGGYRLNDSLPTEPGDREGDATVAGTFDATGLSFNIVVDKRPSILPWILLGLAVIVVAAIIILVVLRSRKNRASQPVYYPGGPGPQGMPPYPHEAGQYPQQAGPYPQQMNQPPHGVQADQQGTGDPGQQAEPYPQSYPPASTAPYPVASASDTDAPPAPESPGDLEGQDDASGDDRRDTDRYPTT